MSFDAEARESLQSTCSSPLIPGTLLPPPAPQLQEILDRKVPPYVSLQVHRFYLGKTPPQVCRPLGKGSPSPPDQREGGFSRNPAR